MSRNLNLAKLLPITKNALKRKPDGIQAAALSPKSPEGVESPYFSPMKTRNARRHIKIQTEETLTKSPTSKIVSKAVVKQKTIDAVNAFAAATATKSKETIVSQKLKIEDDIDVNDIGKPVASKPKPKAKRNLKIENVAIKEEQSIPDENELVAEQFKLSKSKLKRKVKSEPGSIKDETVDAATKEPVAEEMKSPTKRSKQNAIKVAVDEIKMEATTADVEEAKWMPKNWQQLLENIREMRKSRPAPVDTMGCHKCSDDAAPENIQRFHHLVALMLSSQTKDTVTFEAMNRLKKHGLTPETMCAIDVIDLEKLLHPVGFYKRKAVYIKKAAEILIDKYNCDIPRTIADMIKLPGVGPKMAHICMRVAWGVVSGIGVDTHVHRISNRLKWMRKETNEPEQTRVALEQWMPKELWSDVNELLVGFGQTVCTPINPKCGECLNYDICPSKITKKK